MSEKINPEGVSAELVTDCGQKQAALQAEAAKAGIGLKCIERFNGAQVELDFSQSVVLNELNGKMAAGVVLPNGNRAVDDSAYEAAKRALKSQIAVDIANRIQSTDIEEILTPQGHRQVRVGVTARRN